MLARLLTLAAAALPLVSAAGNWTALSYTQSVMMQVATVSPTTAFISGGQNGAGANIIKTTNGGSSWENLNIGNAFMFMATAAQSETSAMAAGIGLLAGSIQYSADGSNFKNATEKNVAVEAIMSAYAIDGTEGMGYAAVGQWNVFNVTNPINGLAISQDAGATWDLFDTKCDPAISTRYASFPSPSTWFVTLGAFPNTSSVAGAAPITRNIHMHADGSYAQLHINEKSASTPSDDPAWMAQIMKTSDSGATFDVVFSNETFYFNQISCPSESVCYAVGENDDAAYAYKTSDSGATWDLIFTGEGLSLMSVAALSETEVWLGGGVLAFPVVGNAIYSADGGNTFTVSQIPDNYLTSISFGSASTGFATSLNTEQQSGIVQFTA